MGMDELWRDQERQYIRWVDAETTAFLNMLDQARADLESALSDLTGFQSARVMAILPQIDAIQRDALRKIDRFGPADKRSAELVLAQQTAAYAEMGVQVYVALDRINPMILRNFARLSLDKVKGITADSINTVRSVLFTKVGVIGENPRKVAKYLAGREGLFTNNYRRLENIVRTESAHVYNGQKLESIKDAVAQGVALNKRIIETVDYKRNHPISLVLSDKVQEADQPFRVLVSDVEAAATRIGKSPSGVFWQRQGAYYVGSNLPAHYMDRGVLVPTQREPNTPKG